MSVRWLAVTCLLLTSSSWAQSRLANNRCFDSCKRAYERVMASRVCSTCLTSDEPAAWVFNTLEVPVSASEDVDWTVRWALLRKALPEAQALKALVQRAGSGRQAEVTQACLTATHRAGALGKPLGELLGEVLATRCRPLALGALTLELLAIEPWRRSEALADAATALSIPRGRFVLDAVADKGEVAGGIALDELMAVALRDDTTPTVARELQRNARPDDGPALKVLVTLMEQRRRNAREALKRTEYPARLSAVRTLELLAPLTDTDLEGVLSDANATLALVAAKAIARGHDRPLSAEVTEQLSHPSPLRLRWLNLAGVGRVEGCSRLLATIGDDPSQPDEVRTAAFLAQVSCDRPAALQHLSAQFEGSSLALKAAIVHAIGSIPRNMDATGFVRAALQRPEPLLVEAALRSGPTVGLTEQEMLPELTHATAEVRLAALEVLLPMGTPAAQTAGLRCLRTEADAGQRARCAQALVHCNAVPCLAGLSEAAANDEDSRVKLAAEAALRKLRPSTHR